VFAEANGGTNYLWRAIDCDGEALEVDATIRWAV